MLPSRTFTSLSLLCLVAACSSSGDDEGKTSGGGSAGTSSGSGTSGVVVTIEPKVSTVIVGKHLALRAEVRGSDEKGVDFELVEASGCGSVTAGGDYEAPLSVPEPAICHVKATSRASAKASDTATLHVVASASTGKPGVWENVTPPGVSLDQQNPGGGDNYGVQDILADPARPSDLYAFVCYQGVFRSTDYGVTWTRMNAGANWGKPWGTAIDPNPNRDPETPPTLYAGLSEAIGFLKSTDFGKTWDVFPMPEMDGDYRYQQVYSIDVDPYDVDHVIVGFHEAPGLAETENGGKAWRSIETPDGDGTSYYPFFIQTGNAETTRSTWLTVPQINGNARALRTVNAGESWDMLNQFQHIHGSSQLFDEGNGTIYLGAQNPGGVHRSTDHGKTWAMLAGGVGSDGAVGVVTATAKQLYASEGLGWGSPGEPLSPGMMTAPRNPGTEWTSMSTPAGMIDGAKRMATTFDGAHAILVAGNWHAGIWRFVEP